MDLLLSTIVVSLAALAACGGIALPVSGTDASSACRTGDACDAGCPTGACQIDAGTALGDSGPASQCDGCPADGSSAVDAHSEASPPDPCGEIGHDDCGACAGPCANGRCVVTLASGQAGGPAGIAVDATSAYWVTVAPGTVVKVPLAGGPPQTLVSGLDGALAIAVDKTSIYWTDSNLAKKAALDGSSPATLVSGPFPTALALDGTSVYVAFSNFAPTPPMSPCSGWLAKVPLAGGMPSTLASGLCTASSLAIDTTSVYFGPVASGVAIAKVPLGGGPNVSLASGPPPMGISVDPASVYWTDYVDGLVLRVALDGGAPVTLISGQASPLDLKVDSSGVYWTNAADPRFAPGTQGSVVKLALRAGCAPVTLASGLGSPQNIAIDGTSVYWTDYSAGTVMKTSK